MVVSVSGYNYSGSGAVLDLLKEYEETIVIDKIEVPIIDLPDGIRDLDYHLNGGGSYFNGDFAIERFENFIRGNRKFNKISKGKVNLLTKEYLGKLTTCQWNGRSSFDRIRLGNMAYLGWVIKRIIEVIIKKVFRVNINMLSRNMTLATQCIDFNYVTQEYLNLIIAALGGVGDKINVLDQLLPAHDPEIGFKYLHNPCAIVVDRDPRDIYALCKCVYQETCFPTEDVEKFVSYHKKCWKKKLYENPQVCYLRFEDLLFDYENTKRVIERFLNLEKHTSKNKYFDPSISINNTQVYQRFPQIKKDIKYIEQELPEYLYDFPNTYNWQPKKIF